MSTGAIGGTDAAMMTTMALQATDAWGVGMLGKALDAAGSSTLALLMALPAPSPPGVGGAVDVYA